MVGGGYPKRGGGGLLAIHQSFYVENMGRKFRWVIKDLRGGQQLNYPLGFTTMNGLMQTLAEIANYYNDKENLFLFYI